MNVVVKKNPYVLVLSCAAVLVMGALVATDKIHADAFLTFIAGLGLPVIEGGRLRNYVFVALRLELGAGKTVEQMKPKEAFFRDAVVRAAHKTPFTVPGDWTRLDERALSASLVAASAAISGRGSVRRVEVVSQSPRRRTGMQTAR